MGVKNLNTFIKNEGILRKDFELHDTKLLVDGSNLIHLLYRNNEQAQLSGGDYDLLKLEFRRFFKNLRSCNVTAFVIFDGGYGPDDTRLQTVLERKRTKWKNPNTKETNFPVFAYETFLQVLAELDVAMASCVFEADREIAVLAKRWKCPVLSDDSDFFIYDLKGGVILTDSILNKDLRTFPDARHVTYLPAKLYKRKNFRYYYKANKLTNLFSNNGEYVLPMFACLMGNDSVKCTEVINFHRSVKPCFSEENHLPKKVSSLLCWLNSTDNEQDALKKILDTVDDSRRTDVRKEIESSLKAYKDIDDFNIFDIEKLFSDHICVWRPNVTDYYGRDIPEWILKQLGLCKADAGFLLNTMVLHKVILNRQVEDDSKESSFCCSQELRALIYGIVTNPRPGPSTDNYITEYDSQDVTGRKVKPCDHALGFSTLPTLDGMPFEPEQERRKLLFAGLGFPIELFDSGLAVASQLILGVMGHWYRSSKSQVSESHLEALIICIVTLHMDFLLENNNEREESLLPEVKNAILKDEKNKDKLTILRNRMKDIFKGIGELPGSTLDVEHGFAQFETILSYTLQLNKILLEPVSLPSHTVIINCSFVYKLCRNQGSGAFAQNYLGPMENVQKLVKAWFELVVRLSQYNEIPVKETGTNKTIYSRK